MSPRYTGEATMDEPALREVERWKEKIEVRLDNRQVFFLFFGSAMVACLLFVLGVIVGKRIESRGRAEAPVVDDPLALLDGLSQSGDAKPVQPQSALTFPRALLGRAGAGQPILVNTAPGPVVAAAVPRTGPAAGQQAVGAAAKIAAAQGAGPPTPMKGAAAGDATFGNKVASPPRMRLGADAPARTTTLPPTEPRPAEPVARAPISPGVAPSTVSAPSPLSSRVSAANHVPPASPSPKGVATTPTSAARLAATNPRPQPPASADAKPKGRFLLHLTSFNDRKQAEAFARRFASANAYIATAEVPGKGTLYRVRVGNYASFDEAAAAKTNFEREHNVIAYVAGGGAKP